MRWRLGPKSLCRPKTTHGTLKSGSKTLPESLNRGRPETRRRWLLSRWDSSWRPNDAGQKKWPHRRKKCRHWRKRKRLWRSCRIKASLTLPWWRHWLEGLRIYRQPLSRLDWASRPALKSRQNLLPLLQRHLRQSKNLRKGCWPRNRGSLKLWDLSFDHFHNLAVTILVMNGTETLAQRVGYSTNH